LCLAAKFGPLRSNSKQKQAYRGKVASQFFRSLSASNSACGQLPQIVGSFTHDGFAFFAQRATAALRADSLRCSSVIRLRCYFLKRYAKHSLLESSTLEAAIIFWELRGRLLPVTLS
jgi:hypothetical protein